MAQFNVGDVVRLKSGGPRMTIDRQNVGSNSENVVCLWFDGTKRTEGAFHPQTLSAVKEDDE